MKTTEIKQKFLKRRHVKYTFSPNGTVEVAFATSDAPFKIETYQDEAIVFSFFGQVKDRLLYHLGDVRERMTPPLMGWILKGCDLSKDIIVDERIQLTFPNIQLKYAERVFRFYIKSLGEKAACRAEESLSINQIFQANEFKFSYFQSL